MSQGCIYALYARVSSNRQAKDKTIDSQIAAIKEKIVADGGSLIEDMTFIDAGVSGATLVRPELERLLLQMQGMIAECERAKIIERKRRGKLHRAKTGSVNVLSTVPYGYHYIRKQLVGEPAQSAAG